MFKSIKTKMILIVSIVIIVLISGSSLFTYNRAQNILQNTIFENAMDSVEKNAEIITIWLEGKIDQVKALTDMDTIKSMNWSQQQPILQKFLDQDESIETFYVMDTEGNYHDNFGTGNISDRDYFKKAMQTGKLVISKPLQDKSTGSFMTAIVYPILGNDKKIIGFLGATIKLSYLQELVNDMKLSGYGNGWIIDSEMDTLAHPNSKYLGNKDILKGNQVLKDIASRMTKGEVDIATYTLNGVEKGMAFAPVELSGWSVAIGADIRDLSTPLLVIRNGSILIGFIYTILGIVIMYIITSNIVRPIIKLSYVFEKVADGDLTQNLDDIKVNFKDEIGVLFQSIKNMIRNLRAIIRQIVDISEQVAASSEELSASGEQVGEAAEQVGTAIQSVASGAEEQSAQVEETAYNVESLIKQVEEVGERSGEMAKSGNEAMDSIGKGKESINHSIRQVNNVKVDTSEVAKVIKSLGQTSEEIGNIVDLINGIAAQTNLLALNAAIEAARAGDAGRGFSVVADEIRELAEESASATDKIAELIKEIQTGVSNAVDRMDASMKTVDNGVHAIESTGQVFEEINELTNKLKGLVENVAGNVKEMSTNSKKVENAIKEIATVSQEFAGSSEEVAASSEEQIAATEEIISSAKQLADMGQELSQAVNKFKI